MRRIDIVSDCRLLLNVEFAFGISGNPSNWHVIVEQRFRADKPRGKTIQARAVLTARHRETQRGTVGRYTTHCPMNERSPEEQAEALMVGERTG